MGETRVLLLPKLLSDDVSVSGLDIETRGERSSLRKPAPNSMRLVTGPRSSLLLSGSTRPRIRRFWPRRQRLRFIMYTSMPSPAGA